MTERFFRGTRRFLVGFCAPFIAILVVIAVCVFLFLPIFVAAFLNISTAYRAHVGGLTVLWIMLLGGLANAFFGD